MNLKNYMEELVWQTLREIIALNKVKVCDCDRCLLDIVAIALNDLTPQYTVSESGEIYKKASLLNSQEQAKVIAAVTSAIMQVNEQPRH